MDCILNETRGELSFPFRDKMVTVDLFLAVDELARIEELHPGKVGTATFLLDVAKYVESVTQDMGVTCAEANRFYSLVTPVFISVKKKLQDDARSLAASLTSTGSTPESGAIGI